MAANLRILYNNVADQASIFASTTASGFAVSNLQNAQKTSIHRTTGSTVTYLLTWGTSQKINGVALPATNLADGDTISVVLYTNVGDSTPVASVASATACLNRNVLLQSGITTSDYTQFSFGGATKTSIWFNNTYSVKQVVILINSSNVSQIDCARIVCGEYWEPTRQVDRGIELGFTDLSEITTTRSGNTYVDRKPIVENMNFQLQYLSDTDRSTFMKIMRAWGATGLVYICVFPDNTNPEITQAYSIYGRNQSNSLQYQFHNYYSSSAQITSW
jgi:hypothetical protein